MPALRMQPEVLVIEEMDAENPIPDTEVSSQEIRPSGCSFILFRRDLNGEQY